MSGLPIVWSAREPPLGPVGLVADGDVALRLVRSLLARDDAALASLRGVRAASTIVLLGATSELPWCDGVTYLGVEPSAPELLAPTSLVPSVPMHLLARALVRSAKGASPLAVVPSLGAVLPLVAARPLHRATLEALLAET